MTKQNSKKSGLDYNLIIIKESFDQVSPMNAGNKFRPDDDHWSV